MIRPNACLFYIIMQIMITGNIDPPPEIKTITTIPKRRSKNEIAEPAALKRRWTKEVRKKKTSERAKGGQSRAVELSPSGEVNS